VLHSVCIEGSEKAALEYVFFDRIIGFDYGPEMLSEANDTIGTDGKLGESGANFIQSRQPKPGISEISTDVRAEPLTPKNDNLLNVGPRSANWSHIEPLAQQVVTCAGHSNPQIVGGSGSFLEHRFI
jgi:hypothetical protein